MNELLRLAEEYQNALPEFPQREPEPPAAELACRIDHTLLKPEATSEQIRILCAEAREFHFATVCVNPSRVPLAVDLLAGCGTRVCTVIAFPLGANLPELKAQEACSLIERGATEVDMVINIAALKEHDVTLALADVQAVVAVAAGRALVKVILETAALTRLEKILGCLVSKQAGADFVKTSTGFHAGGGATPRDVELMRRVVGAGMGVKAAGGIRSLSDAQAMMAAGANRLGSSAGVSILKGATQGATV